MIKLTLLCLSLFIALPASAPAETDASASQYKAAVESFESGRVRQAIAGLEAILEKDPEHAKAKGLLTEVLIVASVEAYLLGNEDQSYDLLSRAMEVTPDMDAVTRMYEKVRQERFGQADKGRGFGGPSSGGGAFEQMMVKITQGQRRILKQTQSTLGGIVKESAKEKEKILESLAKRESLLMDEISFARKYSIWITVGGILLIFLVVGTVFYFVHEIAKRREKVLVEQGERFIGVIQEKSGMVLEQITQAVKKIQIPQGSNYRQLTRDGDTAEKLHRIDIIDAEIVQEGKSAAVSDPEILKPLLEDSDPEVRSRTIQVLLKYNPDEAFRHIQIMVSDSKPANRELGVKLLGGIATRRSVDILFVSAKDEDESVKRQALAALRMLMNENLSESTRNEIESFLVEVSESEGWIVK